MWWAFWKTHRKAMPTGQAGIEIDLKAIRGALVDGGRFAPIAWEAVGAWIDKRMQGREVLAAWTKAGTQWLDRLKREVGEPYEVYESPNLLLLSGLGASRTQQLLDHGERTCKWLFNLLDGSFRDGYGKLAVIIWDDGVAYRDYYATLRPGARDGGMFGSAVYISRGYPHIVVNGGVVNGAGAHLMESVLVHELAHAFVSTLNLPLWLNEGIAQVMKDLVPALCGINPTRRRADEHRAWWDKDRFAAFWDGRGFSCLATQPHCYELAEMILRSLLNNKRTGVPEFILNARRADAGGKAARDFLGASLDELVAEILGKDDWEAGGTVPVAP